jgi:hypothetical protein
MPIDLQALSKDADFQKLSPAEQQEMMATAHQRNQAEQPTGTSWTGVLGRAGGQTPATGEPPTGPPPDLDERLQAQLEPAQKGMPGLLLGGAGGQVGSMLGTTAARVAAPVVGRLAQTFPAIGEALGSFGARKANVALGTEEPGTIGDIVAGGGPLVTRAAGALVRPALRHLPGASATLHEDMATRLEAVPGQMAPPTPSQQIYQGLATHGNPPIPSQPLRSTAEELLNAEMRLQPTARNPLVANMTRELVALSEQYGDEIPMDVLYAHQQRVGEMLKSATRQGGTEETALRRLYGSFHHSLEEGANQGVPGAQALREAIRASRQEHAVETLESMLQPGRGGPAVRQGDALREVKGAQLVNKFDRLVAEDDVFRGSFTQEQLAEVRGLFEEAARLPKMPPGPGVQAGSRSTLGFSGLVGGLTTLVTGDPAVGGTAGMLAMPLPALLARGLMTDRGRQLLRSALASEAGITPAVLGALNAVVRQGRGGPTASESARAPGGPARQTD